MMAAITAIHKQWLALSKAGERLRVEQAKLRRVQDNVLLYQDLYNIEKRKFHELKGDDQMKGHQNDSAVDS